MPVKLPFTSYIGNEWTVDAANWCNGLPGGLLSRLSQKMKAKHHETAHEATVNITSATVGYAKRDPARFQRTRRP